MMIVFEDVNGLGRLKAFGLSAVVGISFKAWCAAYSQRHLAFSPAFARSGSSLARSILFSNSDSFADVFLRRLIELGLAPLGTKVDGLAFVIAGGGSFLRINRHLTDRVDHLFMTPP